MEPIVRERFRVADRGGITLSRKALQARELLIRQLAVQRWMCAVLHTTLEDGNDFMTWVSDGTPLCQLMKSIAPHSIKKFREHPTQLFYQMENISTFNSAVANVFNVRADWLPLPSEVAKKTSVVRLLDILVLVANRSVCCCLASTHAYVPGGTGHRRLGSSRSQRLM